MSPAGLDSVFQKMDAMRLRDGGPVYLETDFDRFIVEPWNTITAILFLAIFTYWIIKLRGRYKQHLFLTVSLFLLLIGGVGGLLYHAFRRYEVFLFMDWMPIMILSLMAGVYFFIKAKVRWYWGILIIGVFFGGQTLNAMFVPEEYMISISYVMMSLLILIPTIFILVKTTFKNYQYIVFALISFVLAVLFRSTDLKGWLPMGTHFLWHILGALASHFMLYYVFLLNKPAANSAR